MTTPTLRSELLHVTVVSLLAIAAILGGLNCFSWAYRQWRRNGGYLSLRPSLVWNGVHVLWQPYEGAPMRHYVPVFDADRKINPFNPFDWPALLHYHGEIKTGDSEHQERENLRHIEELAGC